MGANQFPNIPGLTFKPIVEKHITGYAISSDGRVWNGNGGKWRVMKPYTFWDGEEAVMLRMANLGGCPRKIKELQETYFGRQPPYNEEEPCR